ADKDCNRPSPDKSRSKDLPPTTMTRRKDIETIELPEVESWDDVPEFETEAEEAEFWSTHGFGTGTLNEIEDDDLPPPRPRTKPISLRLDENTLSRLKAVAKTKHKGYQTLLKEFVIERLYEEEKREGLVG